MKSGIFNCLLLFFFVFKTLVCSAQGTIGNCRNDSTVVTFNFENEGGDI